ncbi:hypothetical protein GOP47_0004969 [Adiantum capillus-veneris]|uniref:SEC7 domain-containing protein n=1 Tax=Adiantum capillus-veneris TaxID=13818 RepID=A0A9D4V4V5_ADICA|nr:hypothetical protein GOP47_0004969 [Adiantum capillus-veneris]
MATPGSPPPNLSRLARVLNPALEKVIKNAAWRKHSKLVQDCKAVIDKLSVPETSPSPSEGSDATEKPPSKVVESPLFDGSRYLSADDAIFILQPLVVACETGSLKVVEPALDAVQKLISHGYLRGEVDAANAVDNGILVQLMEAVCKCHDLADDAIELLVLKTLLTAVTSVPLRVHGETLLKAVRTCYNVYLGSKVIVNQSTAKASLTQISHGAFRAICFRYQYHSICAELHFKVATEGADPTNYYLESTDKDMLDARYWEISMYKSALEERKGELTEVDLDREGDMELQITNKLRRDAFLVFRALCKLSMKSSPQEGTDPLAMRGKVIALELLKILLENAGEIFRKSDRFLGAIKQYLCLSLLKNSASATMNIFQLSCSIFMSLVSRFRAGLKAEIGVFFPMIVLRVLENVAQANFQQKMVVLRFLEKLCVDSQILVDVFVNYDCDVNSSNIFERMVNGLLKTAQGIPPGVVTSLSPLQDATLKLAAMKCLVGVLRSMKNWVNKQLRITDAQTHKVSESEEPNDAVSTTLPPVQEGMEEAMEGSEPRPEANGETTAVSTFEQRRAYKLELQEGISLFNKKPRKGIDFLIKANKVGDSPEELCTFLKNTSGLDKGMIGDYLGENEELSLRVMHAYVDSFNFQGMEFDEAIRTLLLGFRLPGEAQKIDRIMEKFAERYCKCNPEAFSSADTAYVLAYSVILLNTDAHNPQVKNKMSKAEFLRNNRGINDGKDIPEEFMTALYDRIVKNEIKLKEDSIITQSKQPTNTSKILSLDAILNIVIRKRNEDKGLETSDDVIRHMQEQFKAKASKSETVFYAASDVDILRPMVEVSWAPMLAAFSVPLDQSEDEIVTFQCLEGFRYAVHITAVMCMKTQRDAFLTSLAKFTSLHSAADIKQKNIDAIKAIIAIAEEDGNYLQDAWEHILTCVSRFEHLHLLGEGAPPDATFFAAPQNESEKSKQGLKSPVLPVLRRKGPGRLQYAAAAARRGSYDSAGVGGHASGVVTTEQMNNLVTNLNMLEQIGSFEMNRIFTRSQNLNSEAIVDFVKALCKVSMEELRSPTDPRVFSLTKIVEIAHYNMNRIRLVWSSIWHVLSEFFISVGCSENLSIAIFAMDSLRQLAMKFLEREELANYNFQNEFMKPFVIVMRKSSAVEIRELIIRCVSQMVLSRVNNVKSGWKIMFMVFTTAATDDHKSIVLLAFETIEKVVREYFPYITETETTTFTDCVNCLIAFTNSRFNQDVSLNAIAFLRFCALKLAEGELGAAGKNKDKDKDKPLKSETPTFTDKDDHLYFWFPLLVGLSELSFDPRPDIRKSALDILFDTLRFHGHLFSLGLWERVFDSVLFPIFDSVRRAMDPPIERSESEDLEQTEVEVDAWLYETCTLALQLVVDLFVKFYGVVNPLVGKILHLLTGFIKRSHQSLAAIGVAAFVRLISNAGALFSDEKWLEVLSALKEAAIETLPDVKKVVESAEAQAARTMQQHGLKTGYAERNDSMENFRNRLHYTVSDIKSRIAVQLLLVQAANEIYNMHGGRLTASHTMCLLDMLHDMAVHAHKVNGNFQLRSKLQKLQSVTQFTDPPLLRLESESYQIYLTLLQRLPLDKPDLAKDVEVESRLVELCEEVLQVYLNTATAGPYHSLHLTEQPATGSGWKIPIGSSRRRELASRGPLVVATLQAISGLKDDTVEKYLKQFFPLLASLISCEHGSGDVLLALSNMFSTWIGPIVLRGKC